LRSLARLSAHRPRFVLVASLLLAALAAVGVSRLHKEEDLLVFLPTRDPDVQRFEAVSRRFGALRVALVGVEVGPGHDVLEADPIAKIAAATSAMRDLTGVDRVVSLTNMTDVVAGPDGAEVMSLVGGPPADAIAHDALKQKVMSRDHAVGTVISADARAALLLIFLAEHAQGRAQSDHIEDRIRETALAKMPGLKLTFGGAPFAARAIYAEAQGDVWRLSPIALGILLLMVLIAFRDPIGVGLTIVSVAYAALLVTGAMGWLGEHWTVATSTLPVILFASGSSYAVHVLGRYYLIRGADSSIDAPAAVSEAIGIVAAPLAIAALTTSVGFFAFIVTDVRPMRAFGVACGAGVLLCWLASLTLVPAVIALLPSRGTKPLRLAWLGEGMVRLWRASERRGLWVLAIAGLLVAGFVPFMLRVRVRMEPRAFFRPGSDPALAEQFLTERFGGATFVQIAVAGDFDEPASLRELARLEDFARAQHGVTQVQSIIAPLRLVSVAMGAGDRLPMTRGQASNLYFFLQGQPEVRSLLSEDRKEVLVHVRLADHAEEVVEALEKYTRERLASAHGWPSRAEVADDIGYILSAAQVPFNPELLHRVAEGVRYRRADVRFVISNRDPTLATDDEELARKQEEIALETIRAADAPALRLDKKGEAELAVERRSPGWRDTWRAAAVHPDDVELAIGNLERALLSAERELALKRAMHDLIDGARVGDLPEVVRARMARSVDDLLGPEATVEQNGTDSPDVIGPAATKLHAEVAGEPVLDRGFSAAVARNQLRSLIVSIVAVFFFLLILFRRVWVALVCLAPALLTLICQMGVMGLSRTNIDLGTSLVAGIATGAGSDFAMHYLWYLRREQSDEVTRTIGPIMALSVALVAVGFFVLGLGRSPVMHLFGGLAGSAMAISALFTCVLLPACLRGRRP
jgi:predicted RND superfamily exporter protein